MPGRLVRVAREKWPAPAGYLCAGAARQDGRVVGFAWLVMALVFFDELACMAAFGVVGWAVGPQWLLTWLLPLAAMAAWYFFASPKARYAGPVLRPLAKVVVFGLACAGLAWAGHPGWALGLLVFSVVVNALAVLPGVRRVVDATTALSGP